MRIKESSFYYNKKQVYSLMLMSVISITLSTFFAKILTDNNILPDIIELYRFLLPMIFTSFFVIGKIKKISLNAYISIFLRGFFLFLSQCFLLSSLSYIALYEAVVLYNLCPFYIYLYDVCNGLRVRLINLFSLLSGFIGVIMILGIHKGSTYGLFLGIASGICFALSQISFHYCAKEKIDRNICLFYVYSLCTVFSLIHITLFGDLSEINSVLKNGFLIIICTVFVGLFSLTNQSFRLKAYSYVKHPTELSIFLYLTVPFSYWLDIVFFHKSFNFISLLGGFILVASLLFNSSLMSILSKRIKS